MITVCIWVAQAILLCGNHCVKALYFLSRRARLVLHHLDIIAIDALVINYLVALIKLLFLFHINVIVD